jgi:hypothetical protein
MMPVVIYLVCALTSLLCAVLLIRRYLVARTGLLLWSSLCFAGLALNNILLFVDLVILVDGPDLSTLRGLVALGSMVVLIYGLVWEVQ